MHLAEKGVYDMRCSSKNFRIIVLVILCFFVAGALWYLFDYDKGRPQRYIPQLEQTFLESELQRLDPDAVNPTSEIILRKNGFHGILSYAVTEGDAEELSETLQALAANPLDGTYIPLPGGVCDMFVGVAHYTPMVKAAGYGWWDNHTNSNPYARTFGKDAAKGKPNYRNHFHFVIRKGEKLFGIHVFCNKRNAEKALSEAITGINGYN